MIIILFLKRHFFYKMTYTSRLTSGDYRIPCVLVECNAKHSRKWQLQKKSIYLTYNRTFVLYAHLIQTGSVMLLLLFSTLLGIKLYEDTGNGRAATDHLYNSALEVWFAQMGLAAFKGLRGLVCIRIYFILRLLITFLLNYLNRYWLACCLLTLQLTIICYTRKQGVRLKRLSLSQ